MTFVTHLKLWRQCSVAISEFPVAPAPSLAHHTGSAALLLMGQATWQGLPTVEGLNDGLDWDSPGLGL